jgi:hypothetical protein
MLHIVVLLIFILTVACVWFQGLWGNILNLVNLFFSMLVAFNFYEPLCALIETQKPMGEYTYLLDFILIWFLFMLSFLLFRLATDLTSRYRLRLPLVYEMIGRSISAIVVAYFFVGFFLVTLHLAPVSANPLGGMQNPRSPTFLFLAPDRQILGFMQSRSIGALSRTAFEPAAYGPREGEEKDLAVFDPQSEFTIKAYQRRQNFEKEEGYRVPRSE